MARNLGFKSIEDEVVVSLAVLVVIIFSFLSVNPEAGVVLFMMTIGYLVFLSFREVRPLEILRADKKSKNVISILSMIVIGVVAWIGISSFLFTSATGASQSVFSADVFRQILLNSNIPILSTDPNVILFIWGLVFPIAESLFLIGVVLKLFNWGIFSKWALPERINKNNIVKILIICFVGIGGTAAMMHLQVRGASDIALASDVVFFGISAFITYLRKQLIEAIGVHSVVNSMVLILGR